MKAAMYRGGEIIVDTAPDPTPGPGQVLVKTLACGICGSDLHFRHHAHQFVDLAMRAGVGSMRVNLDHDIVLGHEFCGEVVDYGPDTQRALRPGAIVCSAPLVFGAQGARTLGYSDEFPGGYGEYMLLSEALMLPVPGGLPVTQAAMTEPMAVGWHAANLATLGPDCVPVVIGCGPVGLAVIASLKRKGIGPVVAADFSAGRRSLAERVGADVVVDPAKGSPYKEWEALSVSSATETVASGNPSKRCVIFECVGLPGMIRQVVAGAPEAAEIIVVGACMEPDAFEPMMAMYKALTVKFSRTYTGEEFADVLHMIGDGGLAVDALITDRIGLDDVPGAFDVLARPSSHAKIMIEPWR